jgi:hypothetical protein
MAQKVALSETSPENVRFRNEVLEASKPLFFKGSSFH